MCIDAGVSLFAFSKAASGAVAGARGAEVVVVRARCAGRGGGARFVRGGGLGAVGVECGCPRSWCEFCGCLEAEWAQGLWAGRSGAGWGVGLRCGSTWLAVWAVLCLVRVCPSGSKCLHGWRVAGSRRRARSGSVRTQRNSPNVGRSCVVKKSAFLSEEWDGPPSEAVVWPRTGRPCLCTAVG